MPGPTETEFFDRAGMRNTKVGRGKKQDAAEVAQIGYKSLMRDEGSVVAGAQNKMQAAMMRMMPDSAKARQHRSMAEPLPR
jgi:short-subunit dehydrogenase